MPLEWSAHQAALDLHRGLDRDTNAAINLEILSVGQAWSEPSPNDSAATLGETAALAVSQETVKPRSSNRELNPCSLLSTN